MTATLKDLAVAADGFFVQLAGEGDPVIHGLAYDSSRVGAGDLFFCIPGARADGHDFSAAAVAAGAVALCTERFIGAGVPELVVTDARRAMPLVAAAFFDHPAEGLMLLGVTGTNGKTTTVFLLESILMHAGYTTGLIGTIETRVAGAVRPGIRTTPESLDLQALLAEMRGKKVDAVAMEVTSHALALARVDALRFRCAAFTNLTQDHLDFHGDMDDYFAAKRGLFEPARIEGAAVNLDDPFGRVLAATIDVPWLGYGTTSGAEVVARRTEMGRGGTVIEMATPAGPAEVATSLIGSYNVSNCLAATATALQAGLALDAIGAGIEALKTVPGRLEPIVAGQDFAVVVDYAHTPDSLANVLVAARGLGDRVVCVFGCGGDRDRGKRPLMGSAAARLADVVIVTSDNPRSEAPEAILAEIEAGVRLHRSGGPDALLADRAEAIDFAIGTARAGDVVVIAGKGHETGQQFADTTIPFDDREVARASLARAGWIQEPR